MLHTFSTTLGDCQVTIETGKLALQAGGAVTVRTGDSMVLVTATVSKDLRQGIDFFPLTVDYEERLYAAGKIPGGFYKREGRPTEAAILLSRLVDRPIRPLFPKGMRNDVQVVVTALSADQEHLIDVLSIIGASAALTISEIPFAGPIGAVRVGLLDGQLVVNPTVSQLANSKLDLRIAGTKDAVIMVEAGANEVSEETMAEAIALGHRSFQGIIRLQEEMQAAIGKPKAKFPAFLPQEEAVEAVNTHATDELLQILEAPMSKEERGNALGALQAEMLTTVGQMFEPADVKAAFEKLLKSKVRERILVKGIRPDGRDTKTIRPITCEVGLLPRAHGSAVFTRGETQVLTIATLGTVGDEQILEGLESEGTKHYLHHYNFPPYSTGEVKPLRGPGRREIGHGALAERALLPMVPDKNQFPYTIRAVSEVLSSNGSTSMASTCASTMALMDAGVPISAPVAGVAMGLVKEGERYAVLTDIQGMEDNLGDMDFKVTGTSKGITALQMDIKITGISADILRVALEQARVGRLFILDKMLAAIPEPRAELSPYAPRVTILKINPEKIGALIGPGGKNIRGIIEQTGVKIDVEDDGSVFISAIDKESGLKAESIVRSMTEDVEIGKIYTGKVTRTTAFGAFVQILPNKEGMVHISQLADYRVPSVEDVVKVGDEVMVMVISIDPEGKVRLSRQAVLEGWTVEQAQEKDRRPPRRDGDRDRGGDRGGSRGGDRGGDRYRR